MSDQPVRRAATPGQLLSAPFLTVVLGWKGVSSVAAGFHSGNLAGAFVGPAVAVTMYGVGDDDARTIATIAVDTGITVAVDGNGGGVPIAFPTVEPAN